MVHNACFEIKKNHLRLCNITNSASPYPSTLLTSKLGMIFIRSLPIITLRTKQNGHQFPDNIFKCIFLNENIWNLIKISLKFVPKVPVNNIPALVKIMAWHRQGDKPLSEPMMVSLLMDTCSSQPQWVKDFEFVSAYQTTLFKMPEKISWNVMVLPSVNWSWNQNTLWYLDEYHGCWCPDSLHHQVISNSDIDNAGWMGPCLPRASMSTTSAISVMWNDENCEYIFMLLK